MLARLLLRNTSSWMPSFSVRIVPAKRKPARRWRWEAATFGWPRNRTPEQQWLRLPDRRCAGSTRRLTGRFSSSRSIFPFLPPKQELRADLEITFPASRALPREELRPGNALSFRFPDEDAPCEPGARDRCIPAVEPTEQFLEVLPMVDGRIRKICARARLLISIESAITCPKIRATSIGKPQRAPARSRCANSAAKTNAGCASFSTILRPGCSTRRLRASRADWRPRWPGIFITKMWRFRSLLPALSRPPMFLVSCTIWRWSHPGSDAGVRPAARGRRLQRHRQHPRPLANPGRFPVRLLRDYPE